MYKTCYVTTREFIPLRMEVFREIHARFFYLYTFFPHDEINWLYKKKKMWVKKEPAECIAYDTSRIQVSLF